MTWMLRPVGLNMRNQQLLEGIVIFDGYSVHDMKH